MLTSEQVRHLLAERNLREVARESDLHYNIVYRVANGTTRPSYETVKKLSDYLTGEAA